MKTLAFKIEIIGAGAGRSWIWCGKRNAFISDLLHDLPKKPWGGTCHDSWRLRIQYCLSSLVSKLLEAKINQIVPINRPSYWSLQIEASPGVSIKQTPRCGKEGEAATWLSSHYSGKCSRRPEDNSRCSRQERCYGDTNVIVYKEYFSGWNFYCPHSTIEGQHCFSHYKNPCQWTDCVCVCVCIVFQKKGFSVRALDLLKLTL